MPQIRLLEPTLDLLDRYAAALRHGFRPTARRDTSMEELCEIEADAQAFVRRRLDVQASAHPGNALQPTAPLRRWIFDVVGCDFVGCIEFRADGWRRPATAARSSDIRISIAPWWRRRGYGTAALGQVLERVRERRVPMVQLACAIDDRASVGVIEHQPYDWRKIMTPPLAQVSERLIYRHAFSPDRAA